jgi:hypothetical protein
MAHPRSTASLDPRALVSCLDKPASRRLDGSDREALRAALARATPTVSPDGDLIVTDGQPVGRVLPHGSVALFRPDPSASLAHRLLEVDSRATVTAVLNRGPQGELRDLWVTLANGDAAGVLPGGAHHPLWGPSDRLVRSIGGSCPTTLTLAAAVRWDAVDMIPPVAEPARLPSGAGAALLNMLATLAGDQRRPALRYRGPYPTEQLFWSLSESFRFDRAFGSEPLARFLADAELTFARGAPEEAPVDWTPAPHERRVHPDGLVVQLRDGVERIAWHGRSYHRTECQGLQRREHRVVRQVELGEGAQRYVASIQALGTVVEDHLVLDEQGEPVVRGAFGPDSGPEWPLAGQWRDALGALLPLEATPLLEGAIEAVWPELRLAWGPVPGDLVEARGAALRLSPKLARVYRSARDRASPTGGRRALAQRLVREVLGLIGPAVRDAAVGWMDSLPPARQEAELRAAAQRDRVSLATAALAPLGRLLDALETGGALPE